MPHRWIRILIYLLPLFSAPSTVGAAARNVVLFVVDDQGFQAGCYGNSVVKTPNLDRLSKSGVRFTHARCTTASCSASRSVLLTGLQNHATGHYGHAHGYNHFSTYESVWSLPVILAQHGYRTCSIGKYHLAPEPVYHFEQYRNQGIQGNRNSVRMAENARRWITEDDPRPFFLYICTSDPHRGTVRAPLPSSPGNLDRWGRYLLEPWGLATSENPDSDRCSACRQPWVKK